MFAGLKRDNLGCATIEGALLLTLMPELELCVEVDDESGVREICESGARDVSESLLIEICVPPVTGTGIGDGAGTGTGAVSRAEVAPRNCIGKPQDNAEMPIFGGIGSDSNPREDPSPGVRPGVVAADEEALLSSV